jgi:predicted RecA/RadA family phage recombinase
MAQTPALYYADGDVIDYTPGSAVVAGDVVVVGTFPLVAPSAIAANVKGTLIAEGVVQVPQKAEIIAAGAAVYWDPTGDPVTGTNGTGAATGTAGSLNLMGWATETTAATDTYVKVFLSNQKKTTTLGGAVTADSLTIAGAGGITLSGTTGQPKITLTTNLADALSILDSAADIIVITTTTGSPAVAITPATSITGLLTATGGITIPGAVDVTFTGTTGQPEIVIPDNVADALSIKDGTGGADLLVFVTTNSGECIAPNVPIRYKVVTTAVAAAGATVADAGQLARANIVHVSSDGATKGVKLATGVMGDEITIINDSGTACELYAASGGTINGLVADASVVIPASKGVWCQCTAADTWIAFDLPAKASAS